MDTRTAISVKMPSNQKFGWLIVTIFLTGFGYFYLKHSFKLSIFSLFLAILSASVSIFAPILLTPLNKVWFSLGLSLGKVVSPLVLSGIFFVLIVPVALVTRLFERDILLLKKRQVFSYWVDKEPIEPDTFKNQF